MKFDLDGFYKFCAELQIETKEDGLMRMTPESMLGTQTYTINEIAKGLEDDIHYFVILKGRQQDGPPAGLGLGREMGRRHAGAERVEPGGAQRRDVHPGAEPGTHDDRVGHRQRDRRPPIDCRAAAVPE